MRRLLLLAAGLLVLPAFLFAQIPEDADIKAVFSDMYVSDGMLLNAHKDPKNWLLYGRDYANTRYSPLKQINQGNVKDLVVKWAFSFGVLEGQDSQAVVFNGRIFVTTSFNRVYSLDCRNGHVEWRYKRALPSARFPPLDSAVTHTG